MLSLLTDILSALCKLYLKVGTGVCGVTGAGLAAGATDSGALTVSPEATVGGVWVTVAS